MAIAAGMRFNHYEIIAPLGAGGMGEVYLAEDQKLKRRVALKLLPDTLQNDLSRLQRFQTEAEAAAQLNHPNIATIHSVEEASGQHFITMEYVEGRSLDTLIPKSGLDLKTFFQWFIPLSDALAHAHEKGIVHRDLKPGNIVISTDGVPKILDFGLAHIERRTVNHDSEAPTLNLTQEGQVLGTPAFMSPEQAEGKRVDHRSDIFSFGVVMYEALTGERPFKGASFASLVSSILRDEPQAITEAKPDLPFLLARLIKKCLQKDVRQRYQAIGDVRNDLIELKAEVEAGKVIGEVRAETIRQSSAVSRYLIAALAASLVLVLVLGISLWLLTRSTSSEPPPLNRFVIGLPKSLPEQAGITNFALSPDGKYLAYSVLSVGQSQLYLRPLDQFEARPLPGGEGATRPFFSADSQWLGFNTDTSLKKLSVLSGEVSVICNNCISRQAAFWADWGEGNIIIFGLDVRLYRISANGGKPAELTAPDTARGETIHHAPQFLPDGKSLLFTVGTNQEAKPAILSLETGKWDYVLNLSEEGGGYYHYLHTGHLLFSKMGESRLMAIPFDAGKMVVTGTAIPVLNGLAPMALQKFSIARNGLLVYRPGVAADSSSASLILVDRQGRRSPLLETKADYLQLRFSPDGKRFAIRVGDNIKVFEVESGRSIQLTREGGTGPPVWTPDGKRIAFASTRNGKDGIYWRASDGSGEDELLWQGPSRSSPYSWHPNGQVLAIMTINPTTKLDIMMLSLPERRITPFLNEPFTEVGPKFSPDGRWVAYVSDETGQLDVYVRPYSGPGGKIPISRGGGSSPTWSADGRELFYWHGVGRVDKMYVVDVKTAPEFTAGRPRELFELQDSMFYDVAPNGQRFAASIRAASSVPKQLNVVLNWTEELKRLAPAGKR